MEGILTKKIHVLRYVRNVTTGLEEKSMHYLLLMVYMMLFRWYGSLHQDQ